MKTWFLGIKNKVFDGFGCPGRFPFFSSKLRFRPGKSPKGSSRRGKGGAQTGIIRKFFFFFFKYFSILFIYSFFQLFLVVFFVCYFRCFWLFLVFLLCLLSCWLDFVSDLCFHTHLTYLFTFQPRRWERLYNISHLTEYISGKASNHKPDMYVCY